MATKSIKLGSFGPFYYDDSHDIGSSTMRFDDLSAYMDDPSTGGTTSSTASVAVDTTTSTVITSYMVDATTGDKTITLITAVGQSGREFTIKKLDSSANKVIVDAFGAETIDGDATFELLLEGEAITVKSDGTNWHII